MLQWTSITLQDHSSVTFLNEGTERPGEETAAESDTGQLMYGGKPCVKKGVKWLQKMIWKGLTMSDRNNLTAGYASLPTDHFAVSLSYGIHHIWNKFDLQGLAGGIGIWNICLIEVFDEM